jgi:hypothetical protein
VFHNLKIGKLSRAMRGQNRTFELASQMDLLAISRRMETYLLRRGANCFYQ